MTSKEYLMINYLLALKEKAKAILSDYYSKEEAESLEKEIRILDEITQFIKEKTSEKPASFC